MNTEAWGVLASWSTALIAAAALVVAILAARATIQTNRAQQQTLELQRQQFEAAEARAERAQAAKVTFAFLPWHNPKRADSDGPAGQPNWITVTNTSDSPVFGAFIYNTLSFPELLHDVGTVLPGQPVELPMKKRADGRYAGPYRWLFFYDSAGIPWIREREGPLSKATEDDLDLAHWIKFRREGRA